MRYSFVMRCPICNCKKYCSTAIKAGTNNYYIREFVCKSCGNSYQHQLPLVTNTNKYQQVMVNKKLTFLHRFIWEAYNNVTLTNNDIVHHINGNKSDNRPSNLASISKNSHSRNLQYRELSNKILELEAEIKRLKNIV